MWKVCPIQGRQLLDVRPEDIFEDFRICKTYRSGGGYDKFGLIAKRRGLKTFGELETQFVVQLYGCHLRCPYCYVTEDGIFGKYKLYNTDQLVSAFLRAREKFKCGTFHLMGGAPALYIYDWPDLIDTLPPAYVFHSDLMLTERVYTFEVIKRIKQRNTIYAVNIKGVTSEDYFKNTGYRFNEQLFWDNLRTIVDERLNFYLTFTNPDLSYLDEFKQKLVYECGEHVLDDSFVIDLVNYDALKDGPAFKEEGNGFFTRR